MVKKEEKLALVGDITFRLEQFAARLDEQKISPEQEILVKMREEIIAYASAPQFAQNALRGQKETVGTLLIAILELEDTFK